MKAENFVQNLDEKLEKLKKDFLSYSDKNDDMKSKIHDIEYRMGFIEKKEEDIKSINAKFDQIDSLVMDIEDRLKQIEAARRRLGEAESRIMKIQGVADSKITQLMALVESSNDIVSNAVNYSPGGLEPGKKSGGTSTALLENDEDKLNDHRDAILAFHKKGFNIDRISRILNIPSDQVELAIKLDRKKR